MEANDAVSHGGRSSHPSNGADVPLADVPLGAEMRAVRIGALSRRGFIERGLAAGISASALGAFLAGCGSKSSSGGPSVTTGGAPMGGTPPAKPTGTLTIGNPQPLNTVQWDPDLAFGGTDWQIASFVFDSLVGIDEQDRVVNRLATDYKVISPTEARITLRSGVKFHDGRPLTAKDVKASIERLSPSGGLARSGLFTEMKVKVIDDLTCSIVTPKPFAPLHAALVEAPIIPAGDIANPAVFKKRPIGSGPFKFTSFSDPDIKFEANLDYWDGAPHIEKIVARTITDQSARYNALVSGQVDLITEASVDDVISVQGNKKFFVSKPEQMPPGTLIYIYEHNGPLGDERVRQALAYAIDRKEISKGILRGLYPELPYSPLSPRDALYKPQQPTFDYDPAKAKELLKDAGHETGLKLRMPSSSLFQWAPDADQAVQQYLKAVGIEVDITQLDLGTYRTTYTKYDISLNGVGSPTPDPDFIFGVGSSPLSKALLNYTDKRADELRATEQSQTTPEARAAAVDEMQSYLWKQQMWLPLSDYIAYDVASTRVRGYQRNKTLGLPLAYKWWLA